MFYYGAQERLLDIIRQIIFLGSMSHYGRYLWIVHMTHMREKMVLYLVIQSTNEPGSDESVQSTGGAADL